MGALSIVAIIIHTLFLGVFLFIAIFGRLITPSKFAFQFINPIIVQISVTWVGGVLWWMKHVHKITFDIDRDFPLEMQQWNLIVANHQSWVDIFVLFLMTHRKLPVLKFFIKKQLIWIPVAGAAWWALDFPFMSRYSKHYLAKHPEKAGQDMAATKRACEKFSISPTTVVNFLEGTRLTDEKHIQQQSPFQHLLKPRAGGVAFAIEALGEKFSTIIDATIHYKGRPPSTWDFACGNIGHITLVCRKQPIPPQFVKMDYSNNEADRVAFQNWINDLWLAKDDKLTELTKQQR